jgi:hypothetical protein
MARTLSALFVVLGLAVPAGMAGAWAFNPDSGALLHSEVLWRIFGVMAEGGLFLIALLLVLSLATALAVSVWGRARKQLH